ncbi:MAG: histidine--tRNA ligase [bacterium]|nr:histidine--tRNA ligase [bacterium]
MEGAKNKKIKKNKQIFQAPKGMPDILPRDAVWWEKIFEVGKEVSSLYDFSFIETPILESAGLFEASLGEASDVIEKQMYVFNTKGDQRLALRPEGTTPICRAYLENHMGYYAHPLKVFYHGQMLRYEQPQAGRYRQHHQWGFEILGDSHPVYDAQIIFAIHRFLNLLKIKGINFRINTIGCRVCRPNYRRKLLEYYQPLKKELCEDCQRRLEVNPLRLLDCKNGNCLALRSSAPVILNHLCQNCNNHLRGVLEFVEDNDLAYVSDPYLVRGLDYYNRTVFEIDVPELKMALAAGGRYDYLTEIIGGQNVPGVGGSIGLERVIEVMKQQQIVPESKSKPRVFFIAVGDQAEKSGLVLVENMRRAGIAVSEALGRRSLKSQLKAADKKGVPLVLIFGQKEVFEETIILRDMRTGVQENMLLSKLVEEIKKRLH